MWKLITSSSSGLYEKKKNKWWKAKPVDIRGSNNNQWRFMRKCLSDNEVNDNYEDDDVDNDKGNDGENDDDDYRATK